MIRSAFALALLMALVACGIKDDLDRPPPLWGEARAEYEARQREGGPAAPVADPVAEEEPEPQEDLPEPVLAPSNDRDPL
jgi:predicted small lipoprotein YifL